MSLLSEYNNILSETDKVMGQIAVALHGQLIKETPVGDPSLWLVNQGKDKANWSVPENYTGGFLKQSWTPVERVKNGYIFSNTAIYADIALHERTVVRGKTYGSLQNPAGIDPTIKYYEKLLEQELKGIK